MENELRNKVVRITELVYKNQELYNRLSGAASADQLALICREQGVELSPEEAEAGFALLPGYLAEIQNRQLSDQELERVAAGSQDTHETSPIEDCSNKETKN